MNSLFDEKAIDLLWQVKEGKIHPNRAWKEIMKGAKADMNMYVEFLKAEGIVVEEEHKPQNFEFLYGVWDGTNPEGLL